MDSPPQTGPIVVYAATGYTGSLVAHELARRDADFIVAGRSRAKLEALSAELATNPRVAAVPLDDAAGLRELLEGAAAVIACAGPFTLHGEPVVTAASATGTHYVDTTGEQPFIRSCFEPPRRDRGPQRRGAGQQHGLRLRARGSDRGADRCDARGPDRRAHPRLLDPRLRTDPGDGAVGAGDDQRRRRRVGRRYLPRGRAEHRSRPLRLPGATGRRRVGRYPAGEQITVPRHLDVGRVRTVIDIGSVTPPLLGPLAAPLMTASGYLMATPVRAAVAKLIERLPEGADAEARRAVRYTIVCDAGGGGRTRRGIVRGGDVYGITAVTTVEGALRMAAPGFDRSGALAPAEAYDPHDFLAARAPHGVDYELVAGS